VTETVKKKPSWQAVYYHYRKWSTDGSLERVWQGRILLISQDLDLQHELIQAFDANW
jgi:hypothetical protein